MKYLFAQVLTCTLAGSLFAQNPKLSHEFEKRNSNDLVDVIVSFKSAPADDPTDANHQKVMRLGGQFKASHTIIRAGSYRMPVSQLEELAKDPEVEFISPDHVVSTSSVLTSGEGGPSLSLTLAPAMMAAAVSVSTPPSVDYFRETAHTDVVKAAGWTGAGVGVAVIDSGITPNEDFKSPIAYSQSFVPGDSTTGDKYGHGTHVAGIIVGSGTNSASKSKYQFGGGAPDVTLINLRALDQNGAGTDSSLISAIQQAVALKSKYNIKVINISAGRPVSGTYVTDPLCQAVEAAWKAGIVVVAAAGNEGRNNSAGTLGYGTILVPGNDPHVITVGAMKSMDTSSRSDDMIASYSSKGPTLIDHIVKPDLVAPGNLVMSVAVPGSTLAVAYPANFVATSVYSNSGSANKANKYFTLSGTSMATPVVSAAVAILLEKWPSLTPDQVKARLMKTASKSFPTSSAVYDSTTQTTYISFYDIFTVGAGYLDAAAALSNTDAASGSALSPAVTYDSTSKNATMTLQSNSVIWGSSVIWGTSVVWGTNVFVSGSSVIWGSSVSWGTTTMSASSVIWGTTSASASSVIWGSNSTVAQ